MTRKPSTPLPAVMAAAFAVFALAATSVSAEIEFYLPEPEFIGEHAEEIQLSAKQQREIGGLLERKGDEMHRHWQRVEEQSERLEALLARDDADDDEVIAMARRVLDAENEARLFELRVRLRVRELLTPAQRERLADIAREQHEDEEHAHEELEAMAEEVRELAHDRLADGKPVDAIIERLNEIEAMVEDDELAEAHEALEQLLHRLRGDDEEHEVREREIREREERRRMEEREERRRIEERERRGRD